MTNVNRFINYYKNKMNYSYAEIQKGTTHAKMYDYLK